MTRQLRILVVIGHWPSKTHPYLSWLFFRLKQNFPGLSLFHYNQPELEEGYTVIGKAAVNQVLEGSFYRRPFGLNPFLHLRAIFKILKNLSQSRAVISDCRAQGLSMGQAYGQLYYYQDLLGQRFDLVHINALQTACHFKSKQLFGQAKVLTSSRGQDFDFFPDRYDRVLQQIDILHVLGTYLKVKARAQGYKGPVSVIPPAFPEIPSISKPSNRGGIQDGKVIIATAARLSWVKGFEYSLITIKLLVDKGYDVTYRIYGDGEELEHLLYMVQNLGLTKKVQFYGWLEEPRLLEELKGVDFYLLLAISEAFNNSVLLAQALGIPCVVSDAGGLSENVADRISGRVVSRYDASAAAEALMELIDNSALYQQFSQNARQRVQNHFSLDHQVEQYKAMYEKVIATD